MEDERFDVILEDVDTGIRPRVAPKPVEKQEQTGWEFASVAGQIGFDIALPMVLGLVIGTKIDDRWGTRPKFTLGLFMIGLVLSCASLIRIVRDATRKR